MGNKILKVLLPLVVLAAIALVVMRTKYTIENMAPSEIQPFEFGAYIDSIVSADLEGKSYAQAKDEYRRIYGIIKTEENVVATDSTGLPKPLLSDSVAQECYSRAFAAYWPTFEVIVEGLFRYDWSGKTDQLNIIKTEAEDLKQRKGSAKRNVDSLTHYLAYIEDYNTAKTFATNVSCRSSKGFEELVNKKNNYKKQYPLCNNRSLVSELDGVPGKAKESWKNNVIWYVDKTCTARDLRSFLDGFYVETGAKKKMEMGNSICVTKIEDFHTKFSGELSDQSKKLRDRWYELLADAVYQACSNANDHNTFYNGDYRNLKDKIKEYGSDPQDLQKKLDEKLTELRGW